MTLVEPAPAGLLGPLAQLSATGYQPHPLHAPERDWSEVNCYVDLWVELLARLGCDPVPALACALSAGVDGDQWTFLKPHPEDLRALYGIEVRELNLWRPVLEHARQQLGDGRLMTVEVDAWFLPDTRGRTYRLGHEKTTIVPAVLDAAGRRLGYFHGPGFYELDGDDFEGLFAPALLPPYAETIVLPAAAPEPAGLADRAVELAAAHLRRAPASPVTRLAEVLDDRLAWLAGQGLETFHAYAFGTARQCGGTAELAAELADWLAEHAGVDPGSAAADFRSVSTEAKALQFTLARVARGRRADTSGPLGRMAQAWEDAQSAMRTALLP